LEFPRAKSSLQMPVAIRTHLAAVAAANWQQADLSAA
jgi:hypothetical protein